MGLGSAYQAGLRIPTPFDEQMAMAKGGGAWPQNRYSRGGGGGGTRTQKKPEQKKEGGRWVGAHWVTDSQQAVQDKRAFESGEKQKERNWKGSQAGLNRKMEGRKIAIDEGKGQREQGEHDWKQRQLKRIEEYKKADALVAGGNGDIGAMTQYFIKDKMDQLGIPLKKLNDPLYQFSEEYQNMLKTIPQLDRDGNNISILFPGADKPVTMTPGIAMGEFWKKFNPNFDYKRDAEIEKTKAEATKAGRAGLMTQKDVYEAAAKYADTGAGIDPELYRQFVESGGPPSPEKTPGLNEKPIDTTGSLSDAAPASTVPEGYKSQTNQRTGEKRIVPISGGASQKAKPSEEKQDTTAKKKNKPKEAPKPKKAGITSEVGRTAKAIVGGVVKGFGKYGPKEATSDVTDKESAAGLKKAAFKDPGPGVRANVPIRSVAEVTEKKKKKSTSGTAEASEKKESDKDGDGKDKDKKKKKKKKKGGNK